MTTDAAELTDKTSKAAAKQTAFVVDFTACSPPVTLSSSMYCIRNSDFSYIIVSQPLLPEENWLKSQKAANPIWKTLYS
jgi:hypothetical protein